MIHHTSREETSLPNHLSEPLHPSFSSFQSSQLSEPVVGEVAKNRFFVCAYVGIPSCPVFIRLQEIDNFIRKLEKRQMVMTKNQRTVSNENPGFPIKSGITIRSGFPLLRHGSEQVFTDSTDSFPSLRGRAAAAAISSFILTAETQRARRKEEPLEPQIHADRHSAAQPQPKISFHHGGHHAEA